MRRIISILMIARLVQRLFRGSRMGGPGRGHHGHAHRRPTRNPRQSPTPRAGEDEPPQEPPQGPPRD